MAQLTRDGWMLFATRCSRMFAYGLLSVVLMLYLAKVGLDAWEIGWLLSLTLVGDTAISLWLTTSADRVGRRWTLIVGALLMTSAGIVFASTHQFVVLLIAATFGVISPGGNEIGPFLSVEQAALSQLVSDHDRTDVFAWYNLMGSMATALGALCGGLSVSLSQSFGLTGAAAYRPAIVCYALIGIAMVCGFNLLSPAVEANLVTARRRTAKFGLGESRRPVLQLSLLFAMDSFAGGFVIQSVIAYWFHIRFGLSPAALGTIFLFANLLAGFSALAAGSLARRIGLVNTMVFTHLPSNVLLMLVPLMPNSLWAIGLLLLRFSISQMDVPTRQAYVMAVVHPEERSAAAGITGVARSVGASISPMLASALVGTAGLMAVPFFLAGGLKIAYDLLLFRSFSKRPIGPHPP